MKRFFAACLGLAMVVTMAGEGLTESQKSLCVFYRNSDQIYYSAYAESGGWRQGTVTGSITASPSAVVFNNKLFLFHQGAGSSGEVWYNVFNGTGWEGDKQISAGMTASPSVAVFNNILYLFFQGNNGKLLYMLYNGSNWAGYYEVPNTSLSGSPSAVVFNDKLYVFHQGAGDNGEIRYNVFNGSDWESDKQVYLGAMKESPSAVVFNNKLYIFVQGLSDGNLYYIVFDGINWEDHFEEVPAGLSGSPSAVVYDDKLYVFMRSGGDPDGSLWYNVFDGSSWNSSTQIPVQLSDSPGAVAWSVNFHKGWELNDAIASLKVTTGIRQNVDITADVNGDNKIGLEEALYTLQVIATMDQIKTDYAGVYYVTEPAYSTNDTNCLYPLVVGSDGKVYLSVISSDSPNEAKELAYQYNSKTNILVFDWQEIKGTQKKGRIIFSNDGAGKNIFSGFIFLDKRNPFESIQFSGIQMLKTQVWASPTFPVDIPIVGTIYIGDHTWMTMNPGDCWRVLGGGTPTYYCDSNNSRWITAGNFNFYYPPEGKLLKSTAEGDISKVNCIGGTEGFFTVLDIINIPKYARIVYGVHGVCHQMTNRLLLAAGELTVSGVNGFALSSSHYGIYGTTVPPEIIGINWIAFTALAIGINVDFNNQCNECGVNYPGFRRSADEETGMNGSEKLANEVLKLHRERQTVLTPEDIYTASPEEIRAFLLENHEIHMKELRLLFEFKAGNSISEDRMNTLLAIYDDMQRPSEDLISKMVDNMPKSAEEMQNLQKRASEIPIDPLLLADEINKAVKAQQKRVANFLTYEEYITLFDHSPEENIGLVDPNVMTNTK